MQSASEMAERAVEESRKQGGRFAAEYRGAVGRFLRLCRIHGPYQMAAILTAEQDGKPGTKALHNQLVELLGAQRGSLSAILTTRTDPFLCLDDSFLLLRFLECAHAHLDSKGKAL